MHNKIRKQHGTGLAGVQNNKRGAGLADVSCTTIGKQHGTGLAGVHNNLGN
jgi:hypothetical protein